MDMRLRRVRNDSSASASGALMAEEERIFAGPVLGFQPNGDGREEGILGLIRRKRHLIDNCFEDENYGVEPC